MASYHTISSSVASESCKSDTSAASSGSNTGSMPTYPIQIGFNIPSSNRPVSPAASTSSSGSSSSGQWTSAYGASGGLFISDEELLGDFDTLLDLDLEPPQDMPAAPPSSPVSADVKAPRIRIAARRTKTDRRPRRVSKRTDHTLTTIPEKRGA